MDYFQVADVGTVAGANAPRTNKHDRPPERSGDRFGFKSNRFSL
jgi:hypothetical protein